MKKLLTILAFLFTMTVIQAQLSYDPPNLFEVMNFSTPIAWEYDKPVAQMTFMEKNWRGAAAVLWQIGTVAAGGLGDGLMDNSNKNWGHALRAVEVGMLISGPFVFDLDRRDTWAWLSSYGFIRLGMKDGFYNVSRGLPLGYVGTTSQYDKLMRGVPEHGRYFIKSISIVAGVAIPIKHF